MNRDVRTAALALALLAGVEGVYAIGFGRLPEAATLGQPLELAIPLRVDPGEDLGAGCLAGQVSFADNPQPAGAVSLQLDPAAPGAEQRMLRLSTVTRVNEPIVTVEITVGCTGRISRRFTLFADPPLLRVDDAPQTLAARAPDAAASLPAQGPPPATMPPATASAPAAPGQGAARGEGAQAPAPRKRAAPVPRKPRPAGATTSTAQAPAATPPSGGGARLQLAPLENEARIAALAAAEEAEQRASAALSAARAASAAEAAARTRIAQLEASEAALRSQAASAEQALAALRAHVQKARPPAAADTSLVPALLALIVLLLAGLGWIWYQRNEEREAHAWLLHEAGADDLGPDDSLPVTVAEPVRARPASPAPVANVGRPLTPPPTLPWTGSEPAPLPARTASDEHKREVSVEELIDLEQQAEFFVVLGQDEAAIDLLMGHLRSTAGNSPLPYLKLLEIYKRRGERKEYERLRDRFNSRFTAVAPDWETDMQDGRSLEDYPSVTGRLESLWSQPQRAMEVLQATLLRADGQAGARDSFDLPAYRELMLLYAVARDRSESESGGMVDLLLPIGEDEGDSTFERLVSTTSLEAQPSAFQPLSLDLTLEGDEETKPAAMQFTPPPDKGEPPPSRPAPLDKKSE
jgi:hypothetical protein